MVQNLMVLEAVIIRLVKKVLRQNERRCCVGGVGTGLGTCSIGVGAAL